MEYPTEDEQIALILEEIQRLPTEAVGDDPYVDSLILQAQENQAKLRSRKGFNAHKLANTIISI